MRLRNRLVRVSENFKKELEDIKVNRIKAETDKDMISNSRLTEALRKDLDFPKIKERLIRMPRTEDIK